MTTEITHSGTVSSVYENTFIVVHVEVLPVDITDILMHFGNSLAIVCMVSVSHRDWCI